MVVKPESIRARLLRLEEIVSELERLRRDEIGYVRLSDRWAIERGLQLGAEIILDLGNHVLTAGFGVSSDSYDDIIHHLGRCGVLSSELHRQLEGLSGFRNLLVHDYLRLDGDRVMAIFDRAPETYSAFAQAIRDWLAEAQSRGPA